MDQRDGVCVRWPDTPSTITIRDAAATAAGRGERRGRRGSVLASASSSVAPAEQTYRMPEVRFADYVFDVLV